MPARGATVVAGAVLGDEPSEPAQAPATRTPTTSNVTPELRAGIDVPLVENDSFWITV
ncbi:MAG TPA: hypothetical protein VLD86_07640 [Ilumatobacteraceae bacterium]|nr:hypothetical protein [Ilumatobacteraceae bacterium]